MKWRKQIGCLLGFVFLNVSLLWAQDSTIAIVDSLVAVDSTDSLVTSGLNTGVASDTIKSVSENPIFSAGKIVVSLLIFVLTWLFIRLIRLILEKLAERSTGHRIRIKGMIPVASILLWSLTSYIIIVDVFGPSKETLVAGLASVGVAIGFAAQDLVKNVISGLVILFDSPFSVGDKIEVGTFYGEVTQIGLRSTKIVTPDDSLITLPNSEVMSKGVSNSNSGEPNCQVVAEIYLPPNIDTITSRKIAIEAAQVSKYIYLNKPITVLFFNEVKEGRPFLKMRLKAYVMDIRSEFAFKSDMTELVMRELFDQGLLDSHYLNSPGR